MFAIVELGGKQHRVREGDKLKVERIPGEVGSSIEITDVLLIAGEKTIIGTPKVSGAKVAAEIIAQGNSPKVIIHKHLRRKNYARTKGHRQCYAEIVVRAITHG